MSERTVQKLPSKASSTKVLQPSGWPQPKGYANGIKAHGEMVFVGGMVGWDANERFPTGFAAQTRQALENIVAVWTRAERRPEHWAPTGMVLSSIWPHGRNLARSIVRSWEHIFRSWLWSRCGGWWSRRPASKSKRPRCCRRRERVVRHLTPAVSGRRAGSGCIGILRARQSNGTMALTPAVERTLS